MSTDTLKRIMWRLRESRKLQEPITYKLSEVRAAIMDEAGYDERTIKKYIKVLLERRLLLRLHRYTFQDIGSLI